MVKINTKKNCKNFLKTVDVNLEYISVMKHWSEKKKQQQQQNKSSNKISLQEFSYSLCNRKSKNILNGDHLFNTSAKFCELTK